MGVPKPGPLNANDSHSHRGGALGGSVGACGTAPVGYGADPPYMPTARRAPAIPSSLTGGIAGVGSNS
jgi:hypothetical protein